MSGRFYRQSQLVDRPSRSAIRSHKYDIKYDRITNSNSYPLGHYAEDRRGHQSRGGRGSVNIPRSVPREECGTALSTSSDGEGDEVASVSSHDDHHIDNDIRERHYAEVLPCGNYSPDDEYAVIPRKRKRKDTTTMGGFGGRTRGFDLFTVGRQLRGFNAQGSVQRRQFISEVTGTGGTIDFSKLIQDIDECSKRELTHVILGMAAYIEGLEKRLVQLECRPTGYSATSSSQAVSGTSTTENGFRFEVGNIREGVWQLLNLAPLVDVPDMRVIVKELEDHINDKKPALHTVRIVTRYILCRIIPPEYYSQLILRTIKTRKKQLLDFPMEAVRKLIGMNWEACGMGGGWDLVADEIGLSGDSRRTFVKDIETETRRTIRDTLEDLRRTRPRLPWNAVQKNRFQYGWDVPSTFTVSKRDVHDDELDGSQEAGELAKLQEAHAAAASIR